MNPQHLAILEDILRTPTAPFQEQAVAGWLERWAEQRGLPVDRDAAGNVRIRYARGRSRGPLWVLAAHMDHPGFVVARQRGRVVWAEFRGGVRPEFFVGRRVRLWAGDDPVDAVVAAVKQPPDKPFLQCRLELSKPARVAPGSMGMWDLPAFSRRGGRVAARACDDLAGVAAIVCALETLIDAAAPAQVLALLTRGEEVGFVGAMAACRDGTIPPNALVVAIEASAAQPRARLGDGVVVRVGDRSRTFDPGLTAHVAAIAAELAAKDRNFHHSRQLMPGGTCESTVYCALGLCATGLCLPLGNYHNMAAGNRIAPERIDLGDFQSLVKLLAAVAADRRRPEDLDRRLRKKLAEIFRQRRALLTQSR